MEEQHPWCIGLLLSFEIFVCWYFEVLLHMLHKVLPPLAVSSAQTPPLDSSRLAAASLGHRDTGCSGACPCHPPRPLTHHITFSYSLGFATWGFLIWGLEQLSGGTPDAGDSRTRFWLPQHCSLRNPNVQDTAPLSIQFINTLYHALSYKLLSLSCICKAFKLVNFSYALSMNTSI